MKIKTIKTASTLAELQKIARAFFFQPVTLRQGQVWNRSNTGVIDRFQYVKKRTKFHLEHITN